MARKSTRDELIKWLHDKNDKPKDERELSDFHPSKVRVLLEEWAECHDEMDIDVLMAELKHLYTEQFLEARRKQAMSGNR